MTNELFSYLRSNVYFKSEEGRHNGCSRDDDTGRRPGYNYREQRKTTRTVAGLGGDIQESWLDETKGGVS